MKSSTDTKTPSENKPSCDLVNLSLCDIYGEDKQKYKVSTLWQSKTAIIIFLRHFACIACRTHAVDVWKNRDKYEKAGSQLYFIGNGQPEYIEIFKQDLGLQDA